MWATASRQKFGRSTRTARCQAWGPWQQVSRLGNPLINEVVIPTTKKDYWNSQKPSKDSQFAKYYLAPEVTAVANALYDALDTPATSNRADLVAILLTGINIPDSATVPGGLQFTRTGSTQADMLRVNTGIKPNAAEPASSVSTVAGHPAGSAPSKATARLPERPSSPRRCHRHRAPRPPRGLRAHPQRGPRRAEPLPRTT